MDTPCIVWGGRDNGHGYPMRGRSVLVHREVLAAKLGRPLGTGMMACHHCDNPPCINPDHLFEGTRSDNMRDAWAKGRGRIPRHLGERHPVHKLSEDDVHAIRASTEPHTVLAARFGVTKQNIALVRRGATWSWLP
jgi:hypothetical protein